MHGSRGAETAASADRPFTWPVDRLVLRSRPRRRVAAAALGLVVLACAAAASTAADGETHVAECSVGDLVVRPSAWDVGCTGGSPAGTELTWSGWGEERATAVGKVRRRYETTGAYEDRVYPLFDGQIVLSAPKVQPCRSGKRQYTHAHIEWTVPDDFPYDTPGVQSSDFDIGQPCPRYLLGSTTDEDGSQGLGEEHPRRIWLGGDSSTTFFRVRWTNWGRATARATARGYLRPPYAKSVAVRIVASRPRHCRYGNDYVYTRISFRKGSRRQALVQQYSVGC